MAPVVCMVLRRALLHSLALKVLLGAQQQQQHFSPLHHLCLQSIAFCLCRLRLCFASAQDDGVHPLLVGRAA
jgi:hypothetical protein